MKRSKMKPNPGSEKAVEQGCLCPILDNNYGRGHFNTGALFWVNGDCPLHGKGYSHHEVIDAKDTSPKSK